MTKKKQIAEILRDSVELFEERDRQYGSSYQNSGNIYKSFFPNGITLNTEEEFARFGAFRNVVGKLGRYAENFNSGGHVDSAKDAIVYSAMLLEFTEGEK